ncbi:uncharacterized protein [Prorops nasuta]|uniref:uncharacterized protein n=1 Tax=Prorops nasuta TaxID=863751 RepID=UPI0034D020A2
MRERSFKKVKDHNKKSGNDRKTCKYYEMLQEIFEGEPWIEPIAVAGTSVEDDKENGEPPKKKTKNNILQLLLEEKKLSRQDANKRHEEKMKQFNKLQYLLGNITKEKRVQRETETAIDSS